MRNYPSIFERAKAYEDGNNGVVTPSTHIVINTNRLWYGEDSTASAFLATAYDEQGKRVNSMSGYFLEPKTDYERAKIEGDDKAIMYGSYNIVPKKKGQRFEWYVDNVPGRTGIAIHGGVGGTDTSGCLLPAEKFIHDSNSDNYTTTGTQKKKKELFEFFNTYGKNGIKINIGL